MHRKWYSVDQMMIVRIIVFYVFWNEINLNTKRKLKLKFYNTDSNFSVFANTMYLPMNAFNHKLTCLSCTHRINFQKRNYHIINFFFCKSMTYKCRQWWYNVNNTIRNFFRLYDAVDAIYGIIFVCSISSNKYIF